MRTMPELPRLRTDITSAVEIVPPYPLDDDDLVALEARYEPLLVERFAGGTLLVTPPAGGTGSVQSTRLTFEVAQWALATQCGVSFGANAGFKFPDYALLSPDATYIRRERWFAIPSEERARFPVIVPDAVFELLSPSDRLRTTMKKMATYLRHGVGIAVLIDPLRKRVYAGRAGDAELSDLGDIASLDCSPVMPGFVLDIAAVVGSG